MNEVEEFYLQHYGVKGMKWGVRKNRKSKGPRTYKDADGNIWTTSSPVDRAKEKGLIEQPNKGKSKPSRSERKAAKKQAKKLNKEQAKFEKEFAKNRTAGKMMNEAMNENTKAVNNVIKKYQVSPNASAKEVADANLYSSMELSAILSDHLRKKPVSTPKGKRYVEIALVRMGDKTNFSPRLVE